MELDFKKKVIIGMFIITVLGIFVYLYYDYINGEGDIKVSKQEDVIDMEQLDDSDIEDTQEENNKIIIHITGAVNCPRHCKNE